MALSAMHSGEHHWKNKTGRTTDAQCKRLDMIGFPNGHHPALGEDAGQETRGASSA